MKTKTLCLITCSILFLFACGEKKAAQAPPPPADVTVVVTEAQEVPIFQEFVGQIFGFKDIAIRARVEGYLMDTHFEEGSRVKEGALLYTLESQPFEEDVAARMSRVAEAKTMLAKAQSDLNRIKPLAEQKAVSESELDSAQAQYDASISGVEATEANLRAAKIQLGYTKIYSPIDGIIGKTKAKVGDFVGRDPNPVILNTVSRTDTILVQFFITETQYLEVGRRYIARPNKDALDDKALPFELILADGSVYEHRGKADFLDREVDPTTGAMLVQASFDNPDGLLRPGQFARLKARVKVVEDGILIPQRCVTELQGRFSVWVVDADNTLKQKEVKTGARIEQFWLITEGLKSGEKVVYEGLQRAKDGLVVNPTIKKIEPTTKGGK
ncbi:MAG: efflux RND transporter periplasmic adaptor subunit [Deltaproteobacteria bacterium]|nr:efflux RND transporter periplasmic adaptor subunit [Deltaproteobacteria bacterium]